MLCSARNVRHLCEVDLSDAQFRFREFNGRCHVVLEGRDRRGSGCGGVLLTVSSDIANTFNSLPFICIRKALHYHRVPECCGFSMRTEKETWDGNSSLAVFHRGLSLDNFCGTQDTSGSFEVVSTYGLDVICYTLVTARGANFQEAARLFRLHGGLVV